MSAKKSAKGLNTAFIVYLTETHITEDENDTHDHICTLNFNGDDVKVTLRFCGEEHPEIDEIKWSTPYILEMHSLKESKKDDV